MAVRRLALEKVGDRDTAEVADALLQQLNHPDAALRDAALARLSRAKKGREALTAALLDAEAADGAWFLARAQAPFAKEYAAEWRDKVFGQAADYVEANDRRADALLFLLREAGSADLHDRLEQRAVGLRKKKAYPTALLYLRLQPRSGPGFSDAAGAGGLRVESVRQGPRPREPGRRPVPGTVR